jgi:hypothetical protein
MPARPTYAFDVEGHTVVTQEKKDSRNNSIWYSLVLRGVIGAVAIGLPLFVALWYFGHSVPMEAFPKICFISLIGGAISIFIGVGPK